MDEDKKKNSISVSRIREKKGEEVDGKTEDKEEKPLRKSRKRGKKNFDFFKGQSIDSVDEKAEEFIKEESLSEEVNISEYLEIAYHYKFLILIIFIVVFIASFAYSKKQQDYYSASSKILIQEDVMELQIINNKPMFKQNLDMSTWLQIMNSSAISKRASVILDGRYSPERILSISKCSSGRDDEYIVNIDVTSLYPAETAEIANAVYLAIKEYDDEMRYTGFSKSNDYLQIQLELKKKELAESDEFIRKFYEENQISTFGENLEMNLTNISNLREMLTKSEVDLAAVQAGVDEVRRQLHSEDNDIVSQTTYSEPLKIRLMNLEVDLARSLTKYTEKHPKILAIKDNIENVKELISLGAQDKIQLKNMSSNPVKQRLVNDLLTQEAQAIALEQKIKALKDVLNRSDILPEQQTDLINLQRNRDGIEKVIVNLENQLNDININANIETSRIFQIQEAVVPNVPDKNNAQVILLVGVIIGLGMGYAIALFLYRLDNRLKSVKDFTKRFKLPVIGTIPNMKFDPLKSMTSELEEEAKLTIYDVFKHITLNFKYLILDRQHNTFAITSPVKGEGKSTIALNMAMTLAGDDWKVVLVDTDFHVPRLSKTFKKEKEPGLSELLTNQATLEEVVYNHPNNKLSFISTGKKPPNIPRMLNSEQFVTFIDDLKKKFDIIIIDTPAALLITEASYIFSKVDGIILVGKIKHTTYTDIKKVIKRIVTTNTEIFGTILNNTRYNLFDKEYQEYHYYYYRYKYGYSYYDEKNKETDELDDEKKRQNFLSMTIAKPFKHAHKYLKEEILLNDIPDEHVNMENEQEIAEGKLDIDYQRTDRDFSGDESSRSDSSNDSEYEKLQPKERSKRKKNKLNSTAKKFMKFIKSEILMEETEIEEEQDDDE